MTKFTDAEISKIYAESRRLLADEPNGPPRAAEPVREVVVPEIDPVLRWREEADKADRERAAEKARMRREERDAAAAYARQAVDSAEIEQRLSSIEARLDSLELVVSGFNSVADGAAQFSTATVARLQELTALADKVDASLTTMRHVHERECNALRDRLAASEATHARETAMLTRELANAQRELDVRANLREHAANRMAVAGLDEKIENVVSLVREDLRERKR
jgi:hypothetical protein